MNTLMSLLIVCLCIGGCATGTPPADDYNAQALAAVAIANVVMADGAGGANVPIIIDESADSPPLPIRSLPPAPQPPIVLPKIEHAVRCLQCRKTGKWKLPIGESAAVGVKCPACGGTMYPYQRY